MRNVVRPQDFILPNYEVKPAFQNVVQNSWPEVLRLSFLAESLRRFMFDRLTTTWVRIFSMDSGSWRFFNWHNASY